MPFIDSQNLNSVEPPNTLYKYLSPERVQNVLGDGTLRFTPLLDTNDSFEVRSTFEKLIGPRFNELMEQQLPHAISEANVDKMIKEELEKRGLSVSPELTKILLSRMYGMSVTDALQTQIRTLLGHLTEQAHRPDNVESLLLSATEKLYCFSLSANYNIAPMWAHYASDHSGLVVSFDTSDQWFAQRKDGKTNKLQEVIYFDGMLSELMENVRAALISKTPAWAYEQEWRLYATIDQIDQIVGPSSDPIHLIHYPAQMVKSIIVGHKAQEETVDQIRKVHRTKFPHADLCMARPNRMTKTYVLEAL